MESSNWLRILGIVALVVGAIYVLLPTVLIDDSGDVAAQAANVDVGEEGPDLTVEYTVSGDPKLAARELTDRLAAAGVGVRRVVPSGDNTVEVTMNAGTGRDDITAATAGRGDVEFVALASVPAAQDGEEPEPPEGEEPTVASVLAPLDSRVQDLAVGALAQDVAAAKTLASLVGTAPDAAHARVNGLQIGSYQPDDGVFPQAPDVVVPEDLGLLLVSSGRSYVGVGLPARTDDGAPYIDFAPFDPDAAVLVALSSPLSMSYEPIDEAAAAPVDDPGEGPVATDREPTFQEKYPQIAALLPQQYRLNLGIDLRGGIDLTLQVDLDEAVLTRVNRDRAQLQTDIERDFGGEGDGVDLEEGSTFLDNLMAACSQGDGSEPLDLEEAWKKARIVADRDLPRVHVETEMPLSDVQNYFARRLEDYEYIETLNLEGDVSRHTFGMRAEAQKRLQDEAIEQVLETLRRRIDATGVKEPSIVKKGGGAISVQLPGLVDIDAATDAIGTTALLEFYLVEYELDAHLASKGLQVRGLRAMLDDAKAAMPEDQFNNDELVDHWLHDNGYLPDDRIIRWQYEETEDGEFRLDPNWTLPYGEGGAMVLRYDPNPITGADINDAGVGLDPTGQSIVTMSFKQRGSNKFCELSSANIGRQFAIVLDDRIESAPNFQDSICGGRGQITMGQSLDPQAEAKTLALVLRTGSLNAPVNVGEVRIVGSTLGADSIRSGAIATLIGGALVLIFMGIWYRTAGWVANFALAVNVLLVLASLCMFGANLTLPGIAGIALTVGMAVDANIIIYERIREEMRLGQHARKAVDTGFDKAMVAVLDANITTAIAGVVLFSYGTGPIRGFAVTLLIGICTTLVTALFVNRTLMESLTRSSSARLKI